MVKIGGEKITVAVAREFFKVTDSKPRDLIRWLTQAFKDNEEHPCTRALYMGRYSFWSKGTRQRKNFKFIYDRDIKFKLNPFDIWEACLNDKKEFNKFMNFLKKLKV